MRNAASASSSVIPAYFLGLLREVIIRRSTAGLPDLSGQARNRL